MADRKEPNDEKWRDVHLDDLIHGLGSFLVFVSDVVDAVNQPRTPRPNPIDSNESFAPIRLSAGSVIAGVRDPIIDIFDEGAELVLVVEWPYVAEGPVGVEVHDDVLTLTIGGECPFTADVLLPGAVDATNIHHSYHNGITTIRLVRLERNAHERNDATPHT